MVTVKEIEGTLWLLDSTQLPVKFTYEAYLEYLRLHGPAFPVAWILDNTEILETQVAQGRSEAP